MSFVASTKELIAQGKTGANSGIPFSYDRFYEATTGIQRRESYLIGASTGVGKSTFVDEAFVYNAFEYYKSVKGTPDEIVLAIDYNSFEMEKEFVITKGILRQLAKKGIVHPQGLNYILSRGKNRLSDEDYQQVLGVMDYFEELEDVLVMYDSADNPTGIRNKMRERKSTIGTYETVKFTNQQGEERVFVKSWTPHKYNTYHICIIDHIALTSSERGYSTKQNIDKLSEYFIAERKLGSTPVIIQQLNYDIDNPERQKLQRVSPILSDFGDSKYTTRDATNIYTLFNPLKAGVKDIKGIPTNRFYNQLIILSIQKMRYGQAGLDFLLWFKGASSTFTELPKRQELIENLDDISNEIRNYASSNPE